MYNCTAFIRLRILSGELRVALSTICPRFTFVLIFSPLLSLISTRLYQFLDNFKLPALSQPRCSRKCTKIVDYTRCFRPDASSAVDFKLSFVDSPWTKINPFYFKLEWSSCNINIALCQNRLGEELNST